MENPEIPIFCLDGESNYVETWREDQITTISHGKSLKYYFLPGWCED